MTLFFGDVFSYLHRVIKNREGKKALFCDENIYHLYQKRLASLQKKESLLIYVFPPGEKSKTREMKEKMENWLFSSFFQKEDLLIAMGGGVTLDLVGFLASTFLRGIAFISIPTTLLAMVDACFGGKTAVNTPFSKNGIGSFYLPHKIGIDALFFKTLSKEHIQEGLAEVVKKGLIQDLPFLEELLFLKEKIYQKEEKTLLFLVKKSLSIKEEIVTRDKEEKGARELLNLGHTIAHGLEVLLHYEIPHGRAVSWGILMEAFFSVKEGLLPQKEYEKITSLLEELSLLSPLSKIDIDALALALSFDKKNKGDKIAFIPLQERGKAIFPSHSLTEEKIKEALFLFFRTHAHLSLIRI